MSERSDLDEAIVADYRVVSRAMDRVVLPLLVERDITMAQFKALMAVSAAGEPGIAITTLGCELSIGQPSASLIVDRLAGCGYVTRRTDEVDRRRVRVRATPAGEELVAELRHGRRSSFLAWLSRVGDSDATALAQGIHALASAAEASPGADREASADSIDPAKGTDV